MFRVQKQQLNDFAERKVASVTSVVYGLEHGLSSTVGTVGNHPGGYRTSDGNIWFCMAKGLCVVDPKNLTTNTLPPPVHIEDVSIDHHLFDVMQIEAGKLDFEQIAFDLRDSLGDAMNRSDSARTRKGWN